MTDVVRTAREVGVGFAGGNQHAGVGEGADTLIRRAVIQRQKACGQGDSGSAVRAAEEVQLSVRGRDGDTSLSGVRGSASGMASADMRSGRETSSLSHGPSKGSNLGMDRRYPPPKASQGS